VAKGLVRVAAAVVVISTKPWERCISLGRFNPILKNISNIILGLKTLKIAKI